MKVIDRDGLAARIEGYLKAVRAINEKHYADNFENLKADVISADIGHRYVRVVKADASGASRSVHSFIDRSNGDILKAAGWKAPAKHARGNVFDDDFGVRAAGVSAYGVRYMVGPECLK